MRILIPLGVALVVAGCKAEPEQNFADLVNMEEAAPPPPSQTETWLAMLKDGDSRICVDPMLTDSLVTSMMGNNKYGVEMLEKLQRNRTPFELKVVSKAGHEAEIEEVACQGKLSSDGTLVTYKFRPSAARDDIIYEWQPVGPKVFFQEAVLTAVEQAYEAQGWVSPRKKAEQAERAEEEAAMEAAANAVDNAMNAMNSAPPVSDDPFDDSQVM